MGSDDISVINEKVKKESSFVTAVLEESQIELWDQWKNSLDNPCMGSEPGGDDDFVE